MRASPLDHLWWAAELVNLKFVKAFQIALSANRFFRQEIMKQMGLLFVLMIASAGCSTTASFYPVEGPIASRNLTAPLKAKVGGVMWNHGTISMEMNGLTCAGEWSSSAGYKTSVASGGLISQYGAQYGSGMSFGSNGGQNAGAGTMMCPDGNLIQIEFVTGGGSTSGFGIAKDKQGNVFRVQF